MFWVYHHLEMVQIADIMEGLPASFSRTKADNLYHFDTKGCEPPEKIKAMDSLYWL
jgi:hypothetical protein